MNEVVKGKYRILREIARSNDIVYEAQDLTFGRRIALKELNLTAGVTGQARLDRIERFNREARSAGRLSHPNIVAIFDFGEENGRHFIAMEYLEGQNLREMILARGALPLKEAIEIASQILDALFFAHRNSVIHRDIKPDNIHILPGGQVKLTDFGIARLTEEPSLTVDGQVFGTPSYMSPEQIIGKQIDHRSDIFALGIVLYEMVTGRKPFVGDNVVSITYAIMNQETPPLPGVPHSIERIIRRALSKNPLERFATAEEMKIELRNADLYAQAPATPSFSSSGVYGTGAFQQAPVYPSAMNMPPQNVGPLPAPTVMGNVVFQNLPTIQPVVPPLTPPHNQPWAWNGAPNQPTAPAPLDPATQAALTQIQNMQGLQTRANYINPPRTPLITLSTHAKKTLKILMIAGALGGGIGFMYVGFLRSFESFQTNTSHQAVVEQMNLGKAAYDKGDYEQAKAFFEKAKEFDKGRTQTDRIHYSLTASYLQLGHAAGERSEWQQAKEWYDKAIHIAPDSLIDTARKSRANVLERLGQKEEAKGERANVNDPSATLRPPDQLPAESPSAKPTDVYKDFRAEARRLINEGDELYQTGNVGDARSRWIEAKTTAPGDTQEYKDATDRLEQTKSTPRF
jgi:serine/threonine-protein kinase